MNNDRGETLAERERGREKERKKKKVRKSWAVSSKSDVT